MWINPINAIDFYKSDHRRQYPEGTTRVYSNFTARSAKYAPFDSKKHSNKIVFFGLQYFIKDFLINTWNYNFFNQPINKILENYKRRMENSLGKDSIKTKHIEDLYKLGYLPLKIKSLNEGDLVPIGVPVLTIENTVDDFFWLTNYIETVFSSYMWKPITSATIAFQYKKILKKYAEKTGADISFIDFQAHDFSFRGMSCFQDAAISGAAHLSCFVGTDTVPAIDLIEEYYLGNSDVELIGCSVPATEHSVMCMGGKDNEIETFKRLINHLYPKGIVSIVSDTWDFWKVITEYCFVLKENILNRDGKVVIRPDSGDPVKIICGDPSAIKNSPENKGAVECLFEIFGGTLTEKGYKQLDSHIGLIYGDSITVERAEMILEQLEKKGFSSSNVVFGIGSYTYQYVTRDSFGFAMKSTSGVVNGERKNIFKDPKTDNGIKKSATGLIRIEIENGEYVLKDKQTEEQEKEGFLSTVFYNGKLIKETSISDIRNRINNNLMRS